MKFPDDFIWGAATSSYQVEGAVSTDGRGPSVWDMLCRQPGRIAGDQTGERACDHYRRYPEDIDRMGEMGLKAYRLSVAWPRILPDGTGRVEERGLAFYDRLVDALLARGIEPWITLFHWDYPQALFCRGGWLHRESADWFADYTQVIVDRLSDRVSHWMTLNEPQCFVEFGHRTGEHAPGLKLGLAEVLRVAHHSLLAHGRAVQVIRASAKLRPRIGAAPVGLARIPCRNTPEDIEAARRSMFSITTADAWNNTWYADPMILGQYPEDGLRLFHGLLPDLRAGDLETIRQPLDFYGANIYLGQTMRANASGEPEEVPPPDGSPTTAMNWPVTPEALYWGPRFLYERYKLPIVITENGIAVTDWVHDDGRVHDPQRIDFLTRHLRELRRVLADGVPVQGYFHWSLLDNFEWQWGYRLRFGLIHVDFPTGTRTPKDSAAWYAELIRTRGESLG